LSEVQFETILKYIGAKKQFSEGLQRTKFESRPARKLPRIMVAVGSGHLGALPEVKWPKLYFGYF
jgi:hypothetical protein